MKTLEIKTITKDQFDAYGVILEHVQKSDGYEPLVTVTSKGWIWALLTLTAENRIVKQVECHPNSKESFEPVSGTALIFLAAPEEPDDLELFLLDRAVLLHEGVWHEVMALSPEAKIKITENNDVRTEYHDLGYDFVPALTGRQRV